MELTHAYRAGPGCCCVCGTSDPVEPIVDLQVRDLGVMNRRFRMYLCGNCALQAGSLVARSLGKTIVDTTEALTIKETKTKLRDALNRVGELEGTIAQFREAIGSVAT
jgi:hypothetical protein